MRAPGTQWFAVPLMIRMSLQACLNENAIKMGDDIMVVDQDRSLPAFIDGQTQHHSVTRIFKLE